MGERAIPRLVRNKALAAGATEWLEGLDASITALEADWGLRVLPAYEEGTEAFVAPAVLEDGGEAVLKLAIPRAEARAHDEATVLRLAAGRGCASLLRHDQARSALLLERLGPSLHSLGLPLGRRHQILCETARKLWRPAPDCGLPTGADKGRWLVDFITRKWEALGRPCSGRSVDHALSCAERRIAAHDDERAVLVHGDVHEWNALCAADGFKLVDPDGYLAEPEYDMGIVMREDPVALGRGDPRERAHRLARLTGLDAQAIWQWGVVERVSTGLVCTEIDLQPVGRQMLALADRLAAEASGSGVF